MDCRDLDPESHDVIWYLQEVVRPRRKTNKVLGTRIYPVSLRDLAEGVGVKEKDIRSHLYALEDHGFVRFFQETSGVGVGESSCTCGGRRASVDRRTSTTLTRSASSGEEGGEWEDVHGPKVRTARNTREIGVDSFWSEPQWISREDRLRERREARREKLQEKLQTIRSRDPNTLNSDELAFLFGWGMFEHQLWATKVPGAVNHRALATNISRWITEGSSPLLIREMIEVFVKDRRMLADGDVAWKVFVNRRALLARRAHNRVRSQAPDDLGWNDPYDDGDDDDDLGWGESQATTNPEH